MTAKQTIEAGKAILGIEFGSTRIKAVLIDQDNKPIAQGSHEWENQLVDGLWTYSIEAIWYGLQDCYAELRKDVLAQYDCEIETLAAIGFSAMMHGYMAFNEKQEILVPSARGATPTRVRQLPNCRSCSTIISPCAGLSRTCISAS
jgi:sugar (pentulose or hexulose) kinase